MESVLKTKSQEVNVKKLSSVKNFRRKRMSDFYHYSFLLLVVLTFIRFSEAKQILTPKDLLGMQYVTSCKISPDGKQIAYTVRIPRQASDQPGSSYSELYLVSAKTGENRAFVTGKSRVSSISWCPDGSAISFLTRRGEKSHRQIWLIPANGGEARQITHSETDILDYRWHPSGNQIAYIAQSPKSGRENALEKAGYDFIFYEENWKHRNLYLQQVGQDEIPEPEQLTTDITAWSLEFSPDGNTIAFGGSEKNLIDYRYMFQKIYLLNVNSKTYRQLSDNSGKLGNFKFSPDGKNLAYAAALRRDDHAVSQVFVIPVMGGPAKNLTEQNFRGHVEWVGWKDSHTVLYRAAEGVWNTLNLVAVNGGKRRIILDSKESGIIFQTPNYTTDFKQFAFTGSSPYFPSALFYWKPGKKLRQLTHLNPWLQEINLGEQKVVHYKARDGMEIEGLLIYPVNYQEGTRYPTMVVVHGGPESHYSNNWLTYYSRPGQILAGRGYAVFYPNYRASTGYGLEFAMKTHLGNAAGTEFDDVADGIDYLVKIGLADKSRVGLMGGSYGGFAAAWFGTYYTQKVKAVGMFVGISDLISKRGTTDIPYEELYVHSGKPLEEMWDISLKRSPIYYAHQSKTAFLIFGGKADPRVNPGQSLELYRRLKMNNHPAVRLVQYPGEGHGNSRQPGRIDVLYRTLDWFDWYVKNAKPLDGPLPPLDISEKYGLELPE